MGGFRPPIRLADKGIGLLVGSDSYDTGELDRSIASIFFVLTVRSGGLPDDNIAARKGIIGPPSFFALDILGNAYTSRDGTEFTISLAEVHAYELSCLEYFGEITATEIGCHDFIFLSYPSKVYSV
jgi:hypothetical protein